MSVILKLSELVKRFDRKIWPNHRIVLTPRLAALLERSKLVIADVGAASGPEERWQSLRQYVHFVTFEPLERSKRFRANRERPILRWV